MSRLTHEIAEYLKEFVVKERRELFEAKIKERTQHLTIVLENVFQGRNISASIRSADCFGIQDVHIIENDNFFNDDSEVSMGAEKWITTKRYNQYKHNSIEAIKKLRAEGYQIIATTPHETDCSLYDLDITEKKMALFFGSEVKGCSKQTLELADKKMKIPMYGFTESYNISVSVSLSLQHLTYKMRKSDINWGLPMDQQNKVMLQWLRNSIKAAPEIEKKYLEKYAK
ncbi:MAG: RNA methyltransferase [Flavobacteriales bacterium]|nr:RNA methyltransferase [Flavobacteriales bacterium]|tara:strand:+ start:1646 stop:2329 length:684 start_codon:yes stop_codon:yes gene_type:complete